jgi:hypothetical protein
MPLVLNGTTGVQDNSGAFVAGTAVASTSGTSIDFTSIPSWVKRVTVNFNQVSTNGSSIIQIQLGSGSVSTSGYKSTSSFSPSAGSFFAYATTGFIINTTYSSSSQTNSGMYVFNLVGSNTWVGSGNNGGDFILQLTYCNGGNSPALSGALDRVRITTVNGTDTFDAGSINILYE